MLSKSQARWFFLTGTILSALIFLSLTIDSIQSVYSKPTAELTEDVIRGKKIWEKNNCMGCHTLLGEGAYYAPELTKSYERRGPDWIRLFLKDPQAMYPGQRKMVKYNFTDQEISDVIAFLKWNGELDLNGYPAKPNLK
ncbi:MAG TPA: cytochrome c [Leptospiraceae bacterium]|nr:cytochrome c [Leptospiraceae bacterium]HMW08546.1 cytochrome c [Leptospiraceae bacterium]HMX34134.1 cytochrome c [Leptospiraceae bacterium]HMY34301.1 cytochrome c [Leptospiraceae bacterium]HMZ66380.1 cytochrome c [Leptospiraceae bacterium]